MLSAAGGSPDTVVIEQDTILCGGHSDLLAYVGHDGLMEFALETYPRPRDSLSRKGHHPGLRQQNRFSSGQLTAAVASPLLWTTGLMAPEAYTLLAAVDSWAAGDPDDTVRVRAAEAYARYQKCSVRAATQLLVTGQ